MRFKILILILLSTSFAHAAPRPMATGTSSNETGDFGLGLMVGTVISATGKYWLSPKGAVDFGLGFSDRNTTVIYADYLYHLAGIFGSGTRFGRETSGYFGGGGGLGFWNGSNDNCGRWRCDGQSSSASGLFIRGLVGLEWHANPTRFGVFAEVGPSILLVPRTEGSLEFGTGGRYYF